MPRKIFYSLLLFASGIFFIPACQKTNKDLPAPPETGLTPNNGNGHGHLKQTKTFTSDVAISWLNLQLEMIRPPQPAGTSGPSNDRNLAYCGISLYEAVVNGMPAYQTLYNQLTAFPMMPATEPGKAYHWAACANAALAEMTRKLYPLTSAANKVKIEDLYNSLNASYSGEADAETILRSTTFGKEVATRVFAWASTDGNSLANAPYIPIPGPGKWEPTFPTFAAGINSTMHLRRRMVPGVEEGTTVAPPPPFSTDPASPFFAMAKDVYDKSLVLTPDQQAMAIYHRDSPGYGPGGGFFSVFSQILTKTGVSLDIAALAYAKIGIATFEAISILFTQKYAINLVRPITYIRNSMGHGSWNTFIVTPPHPEFPSGHAVNSFAYATMFTDVFGEFEFTAHTYDFLGFPPRTYTSFYHMADEMADSRVYGGIHYQETCDKSQLIGRRIGANILAKLKFKKE